MVVINGNTLGLSDVRDGLAPDGTIAPVINKLAKSNTLVEDAPWITANGYDHHVVQKVVDLGAVYRRRYGGSAPTSASTSVPVREPMTHLIRWSEIDEMTAAANGNPAAERLKEAKIAGEALTQDAETMAFYGNTATDPDDVDGFLTRLGDPSVPELENNYVNGGAAQAVGTCCSILIVGWAPDKIALTHSRSYAAGLQKKDMGLVAADRANNELQLVWREMLNWEIGLAVMDERYFARAHSINLLAPPNINELIISLTHRIHDLSECMPVIYMPKACSELLHKQTMGKVDNLTVETVHGMKVRHASGIPIRETDNMLTTENGFN